jgi:hypothetical protein
VNVKGAISEQYNATIFEELLLPDDLVPFDAGADHKADNK